MLLWLLCCLVSSPPPPSQRLRPSRSRGSPCASEDSGSGSSSTLDSELLRLYTDAVSAYRGRSSSSSSKPGISRSLDVANVSATTAEAAPISLDAASVLRGRIAGDTFVNKKVFFIGEKVAARDEDESCVPGDMRLVDRVSSNRAGMENVNSTYVAAVVDQMTKGSPFYKNELKRAEAHERRLARALGRINALEEADWRRIRAEVDIAAQQIYAVVDMDAFFAMVEERADPTLKGVPFAVGGKAMLATANYAARRYGVRSAMPGFIALKLCPSLKIVQPDFRKYTQASREVKAIIKEFDPCCTMYSLDEAYIDLTPYIMRRLADKLGVDASAPSLSLPPPESPFLVEVAEECAREIRERITRSTGGLTVSVGVADTRYVAKMVADINKPNGQMVVPFDSTLEYVHRQVVRKIGGIGKATERLLAGINITTVRTSFLVPGMDYVSSSGMGPCRGMPPSADVKHRNLTKAARPVIALPPRRAIGCERTFRPTSNLKILRHKLNIICHSLAEDIEEERRKAESSGGSDAKVRPGRCITLKIKFASFDVRGIEHYCLNLGRGSWRTWMIQVTRSHRQPRYLHKWDELYAAALALLHEEWNRRKGFRARLLGVRVSQFTPAGHLKLGGMIQQPTSAGDALPCNATVGDADESAATTRTDGRNVALSKEINPDGGIHYEEDAGSDNINADSDMEQLVRCEDFEPRFGFEAMFSGP
eukprot:jgi/Bigna1/73187/fgenesh1_pg.23_\